MILIGLRILVRAGALLSIAAPGFWRAEGADGASFFLKEVQPILENHCYQCHSARAEKVKGGLRLDSREGLLKGGDTGPALAPGDANQSKLVIAVRHTDPDLRMPPKEKLPEAQIAVIEQWVRMGAPDPRNPAPLPATEVPKLWSAQPVRRPAVPRVQENGWVRDEIDAFVLARLESAGLRPVRPADKRTLIRRASFDLTGLPPSPGEVEDFVRDTSEGAFARVADRLLDSPRFGERWGRHWLDLARYADSNGLDQNTLLPNAWRYRDYVVQAFNDDTPYDTFIREQIAGDLLPARDNADQQKKWIATGFLVLGPKNLAEPNREKLLMDVADEQIDVTSRALLGLTVSCARCHDHKFDPIPARDYYAMAGIFRSTQTLALENRRAPDGGFLSQRPLGTPEEARRVEEYQQRLGELERKRDLARQMARDLPGGIDSKELDGIVLDNLDAEVLGDWKLSNYSTNFVDKNYLHDGNERAGKGRKSVRFRPAIPRGGIYEIRLAYTARLNRATNVPVRVSNGMESKMVHLNQTVEPRHDQAFEALGFFRLDQGTNNTVEVLTEGTKGFVVVDAAQFLPQDLEVAALYRRKSPVSGGGSMMMSGVSAARREEYEHEVAELTAQAPPPLPMALAVREGEVRNSRIHLRGDPERLSEEVPRGFLSLIEEAPAGALGTESSGRLALAEWIASPRNPLTARVMVNRIWLHLFGGGLVNTPDNFGSMGEAPSHPELLDFLAAEFMEDGWSVKRLIRRLVLSSTYQLSSAFDAANHARDPENRLGWRMNRKRLDAESLRDAILKANGTIDLALGGEALSGGGRPEGPGSAPDLLASRRRSLYLPVFRGNLNDLFQVFDFPDPHALSASRYVTTAPTQALFLMNSPFILRECRTWAETLAARGSESERINQVFLAALARPASGPELDRAAAFIRECSGALIPEDADPRSRAQKALQIFCQAIIQSSEFRYVD